MMLTVRILQQKLRTEEYKSLPAFVGDVRLLVENAKKFYSVCIIDLRWRVHINIHIIHKLIIYSVLLFVITGKQRI